MIVSIYTYSLVSTHPRGKWRWRLYPPQKIQDGYAVLPKTMGIEEVLWFVVGMEPSRQSWREVYLPQS